MMRSTLAGLAALAFIACGTAPATGGDAASFSAATPIPASTAQRQPHRPGAAAPHPRAWRSAQGCPVPQCQPPTAVCNLRRLPNGCIGWDCCPRR